MYLLNSECVRDQIGPWAQLQSPCSIHWAQARLQNLPGTMQNETQGNPCSKGVVSFRRVTVAHSTKLGAIQALSPCACPGHTTWEAGPWRDSSHAWQHWLLMLRCDHTSVLTALNAGRLWALHSWESGLETPPGLAPYSAYWIAGQARAAAGPSQGRKPGAPSPGALCLRPSSCCNSKGFGEFCVFPLLFLFPQI